MSAPPTLSLVLRRARAFPAPVAAVALNVLVVCTLVSGLVASLTLLQRDALGVTLSAETPERTVVTASSPYDEEDPGRQDALVREALHPVTTVAGGDVVGVVESGTYDVGRRSGGAAGGTIVTAVTGDGRRLRATEGRLPATGTTGPLEVAAPSSAGLDPGQRIMLVGRSDGRRVTAVVTGVWAVSDGSGRWLADLDPGSLVAPADRIGEVAGTGTRARWRAVPSLPDLGPDQLPALAASVDRATAEVAAVGRELSTSVAVDTDLVAVLGERARQLTVLRALLLVPAGLLVLVAAAGLLLVAAGLADVRRGEEGLLRSRGAGHSQLVGPTAVETLLVCGAAALLAPLLARTLVRIGDVRPPLDLAAWGGSAAAAAVCAASLTIPVLVRAATGDRGTQLSVERQRRRTLTVLVAVLVLVAALGALAVVKLRGFGESVGSATSATEVDPLLVASPALLMLAAAVLIALLALPSLFRLLSGLLGSRGVPLALGSRFAARSPGRAIPLALAITLASATMSFAVIERSSSHGARLARASYVAGADLRVTAPADALRAGPLVEAATLGSVPGVESVAPVHRDTVFLDDLGAEVLATDLSSATVPDLLGGDAGRSWRALVERPFASPATGVELPGDTTSLTVDLDEGVRRADLVLAGPDGEVTVAPGGRVRDGRVTLDVSGTPRATRLVAVGTDVDATPGQVSTTTVRADGTELATTGTWWATEGPSFVMLGAVPLLPDRIPVGLSEELAAASSLDVGDQVTLTLLGVPVSAEVAATMPFVRTVADGRGGVLLDAGTVLPSLLARGDAPLPAEWWLSVGEGDEPAVAAAVRDRPDVAAGVLTRGDVLDRLDQDPSTGGTALSHVLLLTTAGCLLVGVLLLSSIVLLRRRERAEQARMLAAAAGDRRVLSGVLSWEYALVGLAGLVAGLLTGALVAAATLLSLTLGPAGELLRPAPVLLLPWPWMTVPPLLMVAAPMVAMLWAIRRDHGPGLALADGAEGRP